MSALTAINYAFSTQGICPVLVERHIAFVLAQWSSSFGIKRDAIKVTAKERLPEGVPFTLTCYTSRSESDPVSMVLAAKHALPHLEDMKRLTEQNFWLVTNWVPGTDASVDIEAAGIVGEGSHTGAAGKSDGLYPEQRDWLEHMAVKVGGVNSVDGLSSRSLAWLVFDKLFPLKKALALEVAQ